MVHIIITGFHFLCYGVGENTYISKVFPFFEIYISRMKNGVTGIRTPIRRFAPNSCLRLANWDYLIGHLWRQSYLLIIARIHILNVCSELQNHYMHQTCTIVWSLLCCHYTMTPSGYYSF